MDAGPSLFASTKLHAPARGHDALLRQRLLDVLSSSLANVRLSGIRWALLLWDEEDNDPSRFIAGVVAALQRVDLVLGEGAWSAPPLGTAAWQQAVTAIINNVSQSGGEAIVLVIDDFHVITEETIYTAVDYLIDRLPANMRMIIGSRHDPPLALSRWRARGVLAEIRVSDLSFTEQETADLINSRLNLSLDSEAVRLLYSRTEGWAASPSSSRALLDLGMRRRQRIFEFLSGEVLDRLEPEFTTISFLVKNEQQFEN